MQMKISIRWALIAGFLGLIWGTHLITTTSSYLTSQDVLRRHARDIMKNIAELAMEQSQRHLLHAHGAAELTRKLLGSNVVSSNTTQIDALERYLHDQLAVNPHFAGIYIGTPSGNFYDVRHFDRKMKGGFRTKVILNRDQGRDVQIIHRDASFQRIAQETSPTDPYDPRKRPWYIKAVAEKQIVWTDPYIFYTSQKPGITIAGPFYDGSGNLKGVVGVDIEIDQLSVFIGNLKIGKHGKAFMLNRNADVVAFGDMEKLAILDGTGSGTTRLAKIQELDDPHSRKAFETAHIQTDQSGMLVIDEPLFSQFDHAGHTYHAMFTPFSTPQWPWIIGVYLPEDDYLGEIKSNRLFNISVTMVISLAAAFIAILLARGVIRPISLLERSSHKMKAGQSEPLPQIRSIYTQIQATANAFSDMKTAVERSHRKYLGIFNNIQDVYYEASLKGTLIEISPSIEKISQYKRSELIGNSLLNLYDDADHRVRVLDVLKSRERINDYEVVFKDKDGQLRHCALNSTLLRTKSGKPYRSIGSLRDISDRKRAEQELLQYKTHLEELVEERTLELQKANDVLLGEIERRRATEKKLRVSEEKYRTILDAIDEIFFEADRTGILTFVNDAACRILGYAQSDLTGMHFRQITEQQCVHAIIRTFARMVRSGDPIRVLTIQITTKNGEQKVLDISAALIQDASGAITGFRGLARDITANIAAQKEKEKFQAWFNQAQRMEALGTLAGGIAHDFNNLLMGIIGNISLINSKMGGPSNILTKNIEAIEQCVESGANLTRQLLGYARGGKYQVKAVNLNDTVKGTAKLFGRTKKEIHIDCHFQDEVWTVEADQGQIEQVLMNIYVNAWQAMNEDMTLTLSTKNITLDSSATTPLGLNPGAYVTIEVQDRGKGIAPENIKRVFEPFFTTKTMGRGTGLGLASAFGIIENHGGMIDVVSEVGYGSTFTIYLPAVSQVSQAPKIADTPTDGMRRGSGTLLVVDDEAYILDAATALLEELGYRVIPASSGNQAIAVFKDQAQHIDGVLLDMIMPDLSGHHVLAELKRIDPTVKVIRCSGYSLSDMEVDSPFPESDGFIQKPYTIAELSATLDRVLGYAGKKNDSP
jgi:two-component system, cell cycle sensor histidine kinase and response regulator CckA